ncbi:ATP-grasp domain-containing protein [Tamaricihabitans halophyticus]
MSELLARAEWQLDNFDGTVDAIAGYWDFPVSSMVPLLCHRRGLPAASLTAVLKCEHKYWSRLEQEKVIDEVPRFGLVSFRADVPPPGVSYPLWLKPVKSVSSELAFKVHDDNEFRGALRQIRDGTSRVGERFQYILDQVELPTKITELGGEGCLAEEAVSGTQVTVEGYSTAGGVTIYGVIDSYNYPEGSSFLRYQYPSALPGDVIDRLRRVSERVINHIGLVDTAFNIEYFWNPSTGAVHLLEINPRHSQSHALLFDYVDGIPNHQCMVQIALGMRPNLSYRDGTYTLAAKWFLRRFTDGEVIRVPTDLEVREVERAVPGCSIEILVREGDRLSSLSEQDSYSYALATIHTGGQNDEQLQDKYNRCIELLNFDIVA